MYLENLINKIKLPFRKDKELYRRLYAILGFYPNDITYYKQALQHKSLAIKGKDGRGENNERLEFLGDAVLDAIVGDIVYRRFPGKNEGFLTNTRSKLVQREMLGKLAVEMGIDKLVRYSGHNQTPHSYMAGNAFEALVGAIYLDYGYERCMDFMKERILSRLVNIDKVAYQEVNFKSKLLEWSQKNRIRLIFEDSETRKANGNSSSFYSEVIIEDITCGSGKGFSKKEAQQNAAKDALFRLKKQKGFEQSIFDAKGKRTAMEEQPQALLPEIPDELLQPKKENPAKQEKKAEKPVEKKQARTAEKKAEKPAEKKVEKPVEKKVETPVEEKPAEKNNSEEKPAEDKPVVKKPSRRRPTRRKPSEQQVENEQVDTIEPAVVEVSAPQQEEAPLAEVPAATDEVKKKPRRRHGRKPTTQLKPNTENSGSEAV